ncbi:hypothetical protein Dimus_039752 [Dionaea muscipula]
MNRKSPTQSRVRQSPADSHPSALAVNMASSRARKPTANSTDNLIIHTLPSPERPIEPTVITLLPQHVDGGREAQSHNISRQGLPTGHPREERRPGGPCPHPPRNPTQPDNPPPNVARVRTIEEKMIMGLHSAWTKATLLGNRNPHGHQPVTSTQSTQNGKPSDKSEPWNLSREPDHTMPRHVGRARPNSLPQGGR